MKRTAQRAAILLTISTIFSNGSGGIVCGALAAEPKVTVSNQQVRGAIDPSRSIRPVEKIDDIRVKIRQAEQQAAREATEQLPETPGSVKQIPTLPDIPQTPEAIEKVQKLEEEGEKLFASRLTEHALVKWQEAYGASLEMKYNEGEGRNLTNMARVYLEKKQWVKAKYLGENAVEVLAQGADKKALGKARVCLAQAYLGLDNVPWAGAQLEQALKDMGESGSKDTQVEMARVMNLAAGIVLKMGKVKESLRLLQEATTYYTQCGETPQAIANRIGMANMMMSIGFYTAGMEEANKALSLARSPEAGEGCMPAALACVANTYYVLGDFVQARKHYEQAISSASKLTIAQLGEVGRANIDVGFGTVLVAVGELDQARDCYQRCGPIFKKNAIYLGQAHASNGLGIIEALHGQYAKAVQHFNQALDVQTLILPKNQRLHVYVLQNLAIAEARSGKTADAKGHFLNVLDLFKNQKSKLLEGRTYSSLAEICMKLADLQQAEAFLKKGIAISQEVSDDAALWRDYTLLARLQSLQQPRGPVEETLTSAFSHFRSPQAGSFPSPESLMFPTTREDLGAQLVAMAVQNNMTEQALLAAEQLKDESFIVEWTRKGGQVKQEDADVYGDLVSQRSHIHAAETASNPVDLTKEWQNWLGRFRALAQQNRSLARLIAPVPTSLSEIMQSVHRNNVTAIEYLVGGTSSVVFTMEPSGRVTATVLPVGRARLQEQVNSLLRANHGAGGQAPENEKSLLLALYNELIPQSVRAILPSNPDQTILIVPDNVLFNLPFAALVDGSGKYLVEKHTLTMACSMGSLVDSPPRYSDEMSLVLASNSQGSESSFISEVFQPEQVTRLVGKDAELGSFQEQSRGKAMVHFASRVALNESNPMRSIVPLAPNKQELSKGVTADRLFGLSMPSDLWVWSGASVNGKDNVQGNALKVISRGLNYVGVRNVLMSLWADPNNQRTQELVEFYRGKQAGLNQAQSLRKAQMIALSRDPSPRTWAGFQLLGPGF